MAEKTYQMLWRCTQCQTANLLALTQRFCPNCGTAQDPEQRYFPPEGQETAVENHVYVGIDWRCQYCEAPNSAKASHCTHCGGPKENAKEVELVVDGSSQPNEPVSSKKTASGISEDSPNRTSFAGELNPPQPAPIPVPGSKEKLSATSWLGLLFGWMVLLGMAWMLWQGAGWVIRYFSVHTETVVVTAQTWQRTVDLERFVTQSDKDWCDSMPSGAYNVMRFKAQRGTQQVADGETCRTVRTDQGDGTFTSRQECETRWRSVPVYDDRCSYNINRWAVVHTERMGGNHLQPPAWPQLTISNPWAGGKAPAIGMQREGSRSAVYQVTLKGSGPAPWNCNLQHQDRWEALKPDSRVTLKVRGSGSAICSSLEEDG